MNTLERFLVFTAGLLIGASLMWAVDYHVYLQIFKELIPPV